MMPNQNEALKNPEKFQHINCGGHPEKYGDGFSCTNCNGAWMHGAGKDKLEDFFKTFLRGVVFTNG